MISGLHSLKLFVLFVQFVCWQVLLPLLFSRLVYICFALDLIDYLYTITEMIGLSITNEKQTNDFIRPVSEVMLFNLWRRFFNWFLLQQKNKQSYKSGLELLRRFYNWFSISKWSNFIRLQLEALDAIL